MDNVTIIKRISEKSAPFRRSLVMKAKAHSEAQCNGDYYYDDDQSAWVGYDGRNHSTTNTNAQIGERIENEIRASIMLMCGTDTIPAFIGYSGDPRGFVLKMFADKMTAEEIELCHALNFQMDWGHDFTITKEGEYNRS